MHVLFVFRRIQEGEGLFLPVFFDEGVYGFVVFQFSLVSFFEFGPALGVVAIPFPEFGGGGDVFGPFVEAGGFLFYSAGPEAVDEDADAVGFGGIGVDAFNVDGGMHSHTFYVVQSQRTTSHSPCGSWCVSMTWNPTF